eukprot:TRINITY_DN23575_c0_g1_i1.p2 TRINITY_DN23575_c0_g1~~TRINITY_DN23575_c0_g1_i1.p2  ORF type:complete len:108 (+),score=12.47 TRINITY_DN23575_c0_g1_i1:29-325(+)
MSAPTNFCISGYSDCPYYHKAVEMAKKAADRGFITYDTACSNRDEYHKHRESVLKTLGKAADSHKTCPMIYTTQKNVPRDFIGGCSEWIDFCNTEFKW